MAHRLAPPDRKKVNGLPPAEGNYIPCPIQSPPTREQLRTLIQPTTETTSVTRTLSGGFLTANCCSFKDNDTPEDDQGVTPYPAKPSFFSSSLHTKTSWLQAYKKPTLENRASLVWVLSGEWFRPHKGQMAPPTSAREEMWKSG